MSREIRTRFLIIGAGPTGLGAGYRLKEAAVDDFLIVDGESKVGGLATSFTDEQGFTWDIGGHIQFSHYHYFDELMDRALPGGWLNHQRESWVWLRDRFVPYPFQNNLRYLPKEDLWASIAGYLDLVGRGPQTKPTNFREWIEATFGRGVADVFMLPYNFKVWATPPELMQYGWIGDRVPVPDLKRILGNVVMEKDDLSWGPNNTFRFPKRGGTGAIWERVADLVGRDRILLGARVTQVVAGNAGFAVLANGTKIHFEKCLSTMPLDKLPAIVDGLPEKARSRAQGLVHSSTNVIGIGMEGRIPPHLTGKCWMYFPEADCPFYRGTVFSHYSPENVPKPDKQWSLMLEVSESKHKPVTAKTIVDETVQGLRATKLISPKDKIVSRAFLRMEYGYPVPSLERDAILADVQPELEKRNVFSRGRFGGWKYEVSNQDHSLMQGVEWADRMIFGSAEETYNGKKGQGAKEQPLPLPKKKAA